MAKVTRRNYIQGTLATLAGVYANKSLPALASAVPADPFAAVPVADPLASAADPFGMAMPVAELHLA